MKISINPDYCGNCGKCVSCCPVNAIVPGENSYTFTEECLQCATCLNACDNGAIGYWD